MENCVKFGIFSLAHCFNLGCTLVKAESLHIEPLDCIQSLCEVCTHCLLQDPRFIETMDSEELCGLK
jgi:hypothetical protein